MIRTYEVQDGEENNNDNDLDFDPEEINEMSWWQKCFVPKYPSIDSNKSLKDGSSADQRDKTNDENDETRNRFYSADVTVSTNLTTPPGTPDILSLSEANSSDDDLETATTSIRTTSMLSGTIIPVIDEGEEDSSLDAAPTPRTRPSASASANNTAAFLPDLDSEEQALGVIEALAAMTGAASKSDDEDDNGDDEDIVNA
jgi:hypothetical protein